MTAAVVVGKWKSRGLGGFSTTFCAPQMFRLECADHDGASGRKRQRAASSPPLASLASASGGAAFSSTVPPACSLGLVLVITSR
jgi:hypothetical protein